MAAELILEFEGVTLAEYHAVNKELGIDPGTGEGELAGWACGTFRRIERNGHLVVIEVWDSPEHQARFMESRLGEALAKGGVAGPPSSITWIELATDHHLGD